MPSRSAAYLVSALEWKLSYPPCGGIGTLPPIGRPAGRQRVRAHRRSDAFSNGRGRDFVSMAKFEPISAPVQVARLTVSLRLSELFSIQLIFGKLPAYSPRPNVRFWLLADI